MRFDLFRIQVNIFIFIIRFSLSGVLENIDDYAVDIPLIWEYMGDMLEPMTEDKKYPLTFLKDVLEPCISSETAGKLVSAVLHCAAKKKVIIFYLSLINY